jgi:energy-coupling factor transporter ATP-binding protein EcfA2
MAVPIRVDELVLNDGAIIETANSDIVVLLGPNNSGKSRTLMEMFQTLALQPGQPVPDHFYFVMERLKLDRGLDLDGFIEWIRKHRYVWAEPANQYERFRTSQMGELDLNAVRQVWPSGEAHLGPLAGHLVRALWCGERLSYPGAAGRQGHADHPEHPVHWLMRQPQLLQKFRDAFKTAFGWNVIVDAWGNNIQFRLSRSESQEDFVASSSDGLPDRELVERLERLQTVDAQSDGVRSFANILLTLLSSQFPLVLLDEPEAFLHPPQARMLGRSLSTFQGTGQLFVATHSLDILLGLVASNPQRVTIVRLTRDENGITRSKVLSPERLSQLWADPLLRFSRALEGLFHDGVLVCEGDTDTQFYSAIADEFELNAGRHVMFTYAGGKQRIPMVTAALAALGVPVRAVVDFDVLREEQRVKSLVESMGGVLTDEMSTDIRVLNAQLRGHEPRMTIAAARAKVDAVLTGDPDADFTRAHRRALEDALEPGAGWPRAKREGLAAVPRGDATAAAERLLASLKERGVWVVPSGAVESFVPAVGGEGPRWVGAVVEGGHVRGALVAKDFVSEILASLPGGAAFAEP